MKAAIENFAKIDAVKKVLLLGAMMELGEESLQEHENLVQLIDQYPWHAVVLVGGDFKKIQHPFTYFNTSAEAGQWLGQQQFTNAALLVKGSRATQMEKVLEG
jgi:UDP-N-acetylmuramoyl-tripeptide--D-alanyl-D-alanine ligase